MIPLLFFHYWQETVDLVHSYCNVKASMGKRPPGMSPEGLDDDGAEEDEEG